MRFLLGIPLRGFPSQLKLHDKYITPNNNTHLTVCFKGSYLKRNPPQGDLRQETRRKRLVLSEAHELPVIMFNKFKLDVLDITPY